MTTITVRASDSALALEEIAKKLGKNAMILSTASKDGLIEITATDEPLPPQKPMEDIGKPASTSSKTLEPGLEERQAQLITEQIAAQASAFDATNAEPSPEKNNFAGMLQRELTPDLSAPHLNTPPEPAVPQQIIPFAQNIAPPSQPNAGAYAAETALLDPRHILHSNSGSLAAIWPDFSPSFYADLRHEVAMQKQQRPTDGFLAKLGHTLSAMAIDEWYTARRLILVGPSDHEKSLVALQLLATLRAQNGKLRPNLYFCGENAHSDAAYMNTRARLIGACTRVRSPSSFETLRSLPKTPDIVVLSDQSVRDADGLDQLGSMFKTKVILVLPQGLHPKTLRHQCEKWIAAGPLIALQRQDGLVPLADELAHLAAMGLGLGWTVQGRDILDGLVPFERQQLCLWAQTWLKDAAQNGAFNPIAAHLHAAGTQYPAQEESK